MTIPVRIRKTIKSVVINALALCALFVAASCASTGGSGENRVEDDKRVDAYYTLGISKLNEQDVQGAFVEFSKALALDPDHLKSLNALGLLYLQLEEYAKAEETFKKAVKADPAFSEGQNNLGITYASMSKWNESIEAFKKAIENPFYATPDTAYNNLGYSYYRKGDYQNAVKSFKESLKRSMTTFRPYYGLALCYHAMNRTEDAQATLKKAIQRDPAFNGDLQKALKTFKERRHTLTNYEEKDNEIFIDIFHF